MLFRSFSLNILLADQITILKGDVRFFSISIHKNLDEQVELFADRDQIQQVLWNLLLNAAEAMPDGGEIFIDCSWMAPVTYKQSGSDNYLHLSIRDTGIGISTDESKLVFEPFFTTKPGGSGLGLASVYRILEAHNASILLDSSQSAGTSFSIILPVPDKHSLPIN